MADENDRKRKKVQILVNPKAEQNRRNTFYRSESEENETPDIVEEYRKYIMASFSHRIKESFIARYAEMREKALTIEKPGLWSFVLNTVALWSSSFIETQKDYANARIFGRHENAHLLSGGDAAISLRHLAIIVFPQQNEDHVSFRVIDLRTNCGMFNENNERVYGMQAKGPIFACCGECLLFFIPNHKNGFAWPERAEDAWNTLPGRIYEVLEEFKQNENITPEKTMIEELEEYTGRIKGEKKSKRSKTLVRSSFEPIPDQDDLRKPTKDIYCELIIQSSNGLSRLMLSHSILKKGLLLGRSSRCDDSGLSVFQNNERMSRVHLLLLMIEEELYLIDTASTNGILDESLIDIRYLTKVTSKNHIFYLADMVRLIFSIQSTPKQ